METVRAEKRRMNVHINISLKVVSLTDWNGMITQFLMCASASMKTPAPMVVMPSERVRVLTCNHPACLLTVLEVWVDILRLVDVARVFVCAKELVREDTLNAAPARNDGRPANQSVDHDCISLYSRVLQDNRVYYSCPVSD